MNQINLEKLLQSPPSAAPSKAGVNSAELKLLVGELYTARLQMLSGTSQLQLQTPQGQLKIALPAQLAQQISQQFGPQLQIKLSPLSNNQFSLTVQAMPPAASSIGLSTAQLQPVISQWLSQQLPALMIKPDSGVNLTSNHARAGISAGSNLAAQANSQHSQHSQNSQQAQVNLPANMAVNQSAQAQTASQAITLPMLLDLKTGQLQLSGTTAASQVLLTLTSKELAAFSRLIQVSQATSGQPPPLTAGRQSVLLTITPRQSNSLQLSLQPAAEARTVSASPARAEALPLSPPAAQQLLRALVSQLPPIEQRIAPDATKIRIGQLSVTIPPQLSATLASMASITASLSPASAPLTPANNLVPLLLQLQAPQNKNGQWQLLLQASGPSSTVTVGQNQADRPINWQASPVNVQAGTSQQPLKNTVQTTPVMQQLLQLPPEVKTQAWRNLLPLLSQPLMQPGSMPNLPVALQQLFSQIQQSLPEISKPIAPPAIAAQLAAALQFQPLQSQPNLQTTGGTLALAIQLLLGHLSQKQQTPAGNTAANRLSQLVSQLDGAQAGSALRQLASLSSPLQQSQLATVDAQSQLQQWLLQLPLQQQGQTILPQLQIEQREADGRSGSTGQKQWQLTMKFDLHQFGNLLAVAKLQDHELQLQFYTDHNQALRLAQKFLPLLKDRCAAQGLTVTKADCQLGKIPESLLPRHNSLLTVKV
ncbi:flagellar hook-length control protein FliK [Arsukibacterium sp. UBA3155]|uniref:flagellar hook-length control protein FliK n=1 Tax=Arsukibacterium sp. UBA3155 TaxID=1946058 RepID=UPI0025BE1678|nr:flagellar hook-length control protein FliK [Arsukibacterium sp. UBA3155]|tara:strand:+ start:154457 stop:156577 length:2121 start_codon:yes stop_codon:yes gene_type:complete